MSRYSFSIRTEYGDHYHFVAEATRTDVVSVVHRNTCGELSCIREISIISIDGSADAELLEELVLAAAEVDDEL